MKIKKSLIILLSIFVPVKRWRKNLRKIYQTNQDKSDSVNQYVFKEKLLKNGDICISHDGFKIYGDNPSITRSVFNEVIVNKEYDFYSDQDFIMIDVGLNIGTTSIFMARKDNIKKIYGFEPFKKIFDLANKNLSANSKYSDKIKIFNFGLSNADKELNISYEKKEQWGMSTFKDLYRENETAENEIIKVKKSSKIIGDIIKKHKQKVFLKIDCEGEEHNIIPDLDKAGLLKKIDYIAMEYHFNKTNHYSNFIKTLEKNGFICLHKVISDVHYDGMGMIKAIRNMPLEHPV